MNKELNFISSFWANLFKTPPNKSELEETLRIMPPFKDLSSKAFKNLLKLFHNRVYQANEYIFYQNDPGIGLYVIINGEVLITMQVENNGQLNLAHLRRGDFFGELALLDNDTRSASAIALKESRIAVIFKPDLDEFIDSYPQEGVKILRGISQIISRRLRNLNHDYLELYNKFRNK
ncbi:MAG: cyclic nucleotide-binding domain-containing protein [Melioribacter sp.]|nr:cyclic nucleotide-binding domain-containing protein [Melioribacter sp.]